LDVPLRERSRSAVLAPIGPAPTDGRPTTGDGSLQVYSARQPARVEFTTQEWLWNNDFGRNDFLFSSAHTDYAVYDEQGVLRRRVQNARDANDSEPAIVSLRQVVMKSRLRHCVTRVRLDLNRDSNQSKTKEERGEILGGCQTKESAENVSFDRRGLELVARSARA